MNPADAAFAAPWEARVFALTLTLQEQGLFTSTEWAAALATEIQRAQAGGDSDDGSTHYQHWLSAIERLVVEKSVVATYHLQARQAAWDRAAHATPHGQPILLENDPSPRSDGLLEVREHNGALIGEEDQLVEGHR